MTVRAFREPSVIHAEHLRIIEAIEHNFADEAERQARGHVIGARQMIEKQMQQGTFVPQLGWVRRRRARGETRPLEQLYWRRVERGEGRSEVIDPATAKAFARVGTVGLAEVKDALHHAEAALPKWRVLTVKERGALLHKVDR